MVTGAVLPYKMEISVADGFKYVVYSAVLAVIIQVFVRQITLLIMGPHSPKRGVAPRLATKMVSVLFNSFIVCRAIKLLVDPDPAIQLDRMYGFSPASQFLFSIAAGYFLWATLLSLVYKGSVVAIAQNGLQCMICMMAMHPFMHYFGNVVLLSQGSTLVLDLYSCGRLLVRRKSYAYLFLRVLHPWTFFAVRIAVAAPVSANFIWDLITLLLAGNAHSSAVVGFVIVSIVMMNLMNMYWIFCLISARSVGSVISEARGGSTMNVKWFAFNLNWFDVGVTLSFGDLQMGKHKLNISNSSYQYAKPGLAAPLGFLAVATGIGARVGQSENALMESVAIAAATYIVVKIFGSASKFGLTLSRREHSKRAEDLSPRSTPFNRVPEVRRLVDQVQVRYHNDPAVSTGGDEHLLSRIAANTPLPQGKTEFSSIHVVGPPDAAQSAIADKILESLALGNSKRLQKELHLHRLPDCCCAQPVPTAMDEYAAIFSVASQLILERADRASLIVFVGWEDSSFDFYAALIGMLPFRGVSTALVTQRTLYGDLLHYTAPSNVFEIEGSNAARIGMFPVKAVFGRLHDKTVVQAIDEWVPVEIEPFVDHPDQQRHPAINLPFKIGGLIIPMLTHNGAYQHSLEALATLLAKRFGNKYFPIVSCGETCDALGYGHDILAACTQEGYYFAHKSGETFKCWENYGTAELFDKIAEAKKQQLPIVIIAVGGGVNGNCIGLIAACTNVHLVEVPTTPMHYNDATTSAKKAFSLVKNNRILSKNILGAFYIPQLVFCVSETFLTLSSANVHATIGESCKTMNMLGMTNTAVGAKDYYNIEGGAEFASDCTKIVQHVTGFDELVKFIEDPETRQLKAEIIAVGQKLRRESGGSTLQSLQRRARLLSSFRDRYYSLGANSTKKIKDFLSVVNREIVLAKAMFLAYSDPFEKYRALLFEYAHTLGHGVEAYANLAYQMAADRGIAVPESAVKLHGQCVGMAVLWAGQMSFDLGELNGSNFELHQSFVYLFNRHGGFDFRPLRALLDELSVTKQQFCNGVLDVVRRDNKRGYCACSGPSKSVDQLVTGRPGKMMRSTDKNAELRYLVEVDEAWQERVLSMAYDGLFDKVADLNEEGKLSFIKRSTIKSLDSLTSSSEDVGAFVHNAMATIYGVAKRDGSNDKWWWMNSTEEQVHDLQCYPAAKPSGTASQTWGMRQR